MNPIIRNYPNKSFIPKSDLRVLYSLNLQKNGTMQKTLSKNRYMENGIFVMYSQDELIIGWALLHVSSWYHLLADFYVRKNLRGRGYGKILFEHVHRCMARERKLIHVADDLESIGFFNRFEEIKDRSWKFSA